MEGQLNPRAVQVSGQTAAEKANPKLNVMREKFFHVVSSHFRNVTKVACPLSIKNTIRADIDSSRRPGSA
jgi:hypothetical protein